LPPAPQIEADCAGLSKSMVVGPAASWPFAMRTFELNARKFVPLSAVAPKPPHWSSTAPPLPGAGPLNVSPMPL
jgi:hypothetical protein